MDVSQIKQNKCTNYGYLQWIKSIVERFNHFSHGIRKCKYKNLQVKRSYHFDDVRSLAFGNVMTREALREPLLYPVAVT